MLPLFFEIPVIVRTMNFDFTQEPGKNMHKREPLNITNPLVSIITPYYNADKYFEQLYNCVMNQTFPWFEWIIVNDGSTKKESVELLENIGKRDARIRIIHKPNGGSASARNRGIEASKTDFLIPVDADDLIEPTFVELLYWALYFNLDCAWAYTDSCGFQGQEYVWKKRFDAETLKTYNFLVATAAIRKKALIEVDGYDELEGNNYEDWRLWLKILAKGNRPVKVNSIEFWYRRIQTGKLSSLHENESLKNRAQELIHDVAASVDVSVRAKEFMEYRYEDRFTIPKISNFAEQFVDDGKISILFLIPWMVTGGADQFNLDFVRLIDKNKYRITIVCTVSSENGWKQKFRKYVDDIFCLPEFLDVENYAEFISYIIQTRKVDVCLISNSYYGYYLAPWLRLNYPKMAILDYVHMEEWYWRAGGYGRTSMAMADILEKTYVCNNATKRNFENIFKRNSNKIETIHIGVDQYKYDPEKIEYGLVKKKYGLESAQIVLFPCRLHAQKRPLLMVEIARKTVKANSLICFLVVGDGPEKQKMQNLVKKYSLEKNIIFVGEQEDMRPFYRDSDVTLICSIKEGLSLTAYESCSMATPVITADVGGQTDLIDEKVGRVIPCFQDEEDIQQELYDDKEVETYTNAILELLNADNKGLYSKMCLECRKRINQAFGLDSMIQKMEKAIQECFLVERVNARQQTAAALNMYPNLVRDVLSMYVSYESVEQDCGRAWNAVNELRCALDSQTHILSLKVCELDLKSGECNSYKVMYESILNSVSFRCGRVLTWIPRKVRGFARCVKDHGIVYTTKYCIKKILN